MGFGKVGRRSSNRDRCVRAALRCAHEFGERQCKCGIRHMFRRRSRDVGDGQVRPVLPRQAASIPQIIPGGILDSVTSSDEDMGVRYSRLPTSRPGFELTRFLTVKFDSAARLQPSSQHFQDHCRRSERRVDCFKLAVGCNDSGTVRNTCTHVAQHASCCTKISRIVDRLGSTGPEGQSSSHTSTTPVTETRRDG